MFKSYPLFRRLLFFIGLPLALLLFGVFFYLKSGLPPVSGNAVKSDIQENISIIRDEYGVPHVTAVTDHDAFYAMGYLHAQDRLWQMETQRRFGAGRLSEIFGASSLSTDKYIRTLGIYLAAKASWQHLDTSVKASLQAYTDGVNAWIDEDQVLSPEFLMLGVKPEQWLVYDSLVIAKVIALSLSGDYSKDLGRLSHVRDVGQKMAADLTAKSIESEITVVNSLSPSVLLEVNPEFEKLQNRLAIQFGIALPNIGSNNWVVSGKHTSSGKPILANDPHMASQAPSLWYLVDLQGEQLEVAGATIPGLPYILSGHNQYISWGITNMATDSIDLFMERTNPQNREQVEGLKGMLDLKSRREFIHVKPEILRLPDEPVEIVIRHSTHGPMISDVINNTDIELAISWTGLTDKDTSTQSMMKINYAQNWQQFRNALSFHIAPTLNFVYADTAGNIGYSSAGRVPVRKQGNGRLPVPGWNDYFNWDGWIPFEQMPQEYNPTSGIIVTANNKVVSDDYPYFLGDNWSPSLRADRIENLLKATINKQEKITVASMVSIQGDQYSETAAQLLPYLLTTLNEHPLNESFKQAKPYLQNWDAVMSKNSVATTIYHSWLSQLQHLVLEDDIEDHSGFLEKPRAIFFINLFAKGKQQWCDDNKSSEIESCAFMSKTAMTRALVELEHKLGDDMQDWTWGTVHKVQYRHMPFSQIRGLKKIFHRELSNGGGDNTVNVATASFVDEFKFLQYAQPSYRQIIDLAEFNNSLFINTPGQSGNILSPHYDDLMNIHGEVKYIPMHIDKQAENYNKFQLLTQEGQGH